MIRDTALSREDLVGLADAAMALIEKEEWAAAESILSVLALIGFMPPPLGGAHALALAELGQSTRALRAFEIAEEMGGAGALIERVREFLPGGKLNRRAREAMQQDAEKWLPRGPRAKR